jgi:chemotaxis protein MotB
LLLAGMGVMTSGCVTKSTYLKQVGATNELQADKNTLTSQLSSLGQQKASCDQNLAAAKADNEKCLQDLAANKGELTKRVADLSRENAGLTQQLRDTQQAKEAEIGKLKGAYDELVGNLKEQINAGQIQITQLAGRLSVNMVDKILFNSGEANVKPEGEQVLKKVGDALKNIQGKAIRVEGHTDNVPIAGALKDRFPSNWELSTARATAVVRYLQENTGITPDRLIAAGYGEFHPVAANTTPEGRAQNRRIELALVPLETVAVSSSTTSSSTAPVVSPPKP